MFSVFVVFIFCCVYNGGSVMVGSSIVKCVLFDVVVLRWMLLLCISVMCCMIVSFRLKLLVWWL